MTASVRTRYFDERTRTIEVKTQQMSEDEAIALFHKLLKHHHDVGLIVECIIEFENSRLYWLDPMGEKIMTTMNDDNEEM